MHSRACKLLAQWAGYARRPRRWIMPSGHGNSDESQQENQNCPGKRQYQWNQWHYGFHSIDRMGVVRARRCGHGENLYWSDGAF